MTTRLSFTLPDSEALRLAEICRAFGDDPPEVIADAVHLHLDLAETDVCAPAARPAYSAGEAFSFSLPDSEAAALEALCFRLGFAPPYGIIDAVRLHLDFICATARKELANWRPGACESP